MTTWWCEQAWLADAPVARVRVEAAGGTITAVVPDVDPQPEDVRLPGLVLPGFANAHSHAFHRALRGRTHDEDGTFWTWRKRMYAVACRLDPDSYLDLARAAYAEMALAGVTAVGEFHYLHHGPDGVPYDDPNAMALSLLQAADDAGLRLTLLDTCYLAGGLSGDGHAPLEGVQTRFGDGDAEHWAARVAALRSAMHSSPQSIVVGAAVHSVRAVPRDQLGGMRAAVEGWRADGPTPLHVHLSEQPAENEACQRFYGLTPTALLDDEGLLGEHSTVVHATHLSDHDIVRIGRTTTTACFCPTTERDLADGIGPARALADAGAPVALGSDQHAVVDPFEEARGLEAHERLNTLQRGRFAPSQLLTAMTSAGHASLGRPGAGRIEVGSPADLVAVRLDSVRTAGSRAEQVVHCATAADVHHVVAGGRTIVEDGQHVLGDVGALLREAIEPLWEGL
ncbi:MAG TPA: formimidoylglutamate deiminase [Actinomycetales bacterium]|nr:formimidoylglutamate deiminase [Actinomycetales bacterium]